jgi:hypothetical protein
VHEAVVIAGGDVGVDPPPQALIEAVGPIDVGDRHDHSLEPHREGRGLGRLRRGVIAPLLRAHWDLL